MRALESNELYAVGGGGQEEKDERTTGQKVAECMVEEGVNTGWLGVAMTVVAPMAPALTGAYYAGLAVGCVLIATRPTDSGYAPYYSGGCY